MKKKLCIIFIALVLILTTINMLPDYQIANESNITSGQSKEVRLSVVIYKFWTIKSTTELIVREHTKINGTPNSIILDIYGSHYCLNQGFEPYKTITMNFY
ncbi:hypothetical protein [Faecalicatena contorta]|uniref:hypothetical protein n=1 Tax=Faecalicatena contorta TaxID=39482 RepID=UPI0018973A61|nr:hypothetical protein [Faecalicatena contorta]